MRDRIVRALCWVLALLAPWTRWHKPAGRHSAAFFADQHTTADQPEPVSVWRAPWQGPSAETVREIFREGAGLPHLQRERSWAAAFAEIGVDYDHPTTNITPVRAGAHA